MLSRELNQLLNRLVRIQPTIPELVTGGRISVLELLSTVGTSGMALYSNNIMTDKIDIIFCFKFRWQSLFAPRTCAIMNLFTGMLATLSFNKFHLLVVPIHKRRSRQTEDQVYRHYEHDALDGLTCLVNGGSRHGNEIRVTDGHGKRTVFG